MEFTIKNFGPISEAVIDLSKDLIIITGENNSGKTFAANLIYSLFNQEYGNLPDSPSRLEVLNEKNKLISKIDLLSYFDLTKSNFKTKILQKLKKNISKDFSIDEYQIKRATFNIQFNNYFKYIFNELLIDEHKLMGVPNNGNVELKITKNKNDRIITFITTSIVNEYLDGWKYFIWTDLSIRIRRILFNDTFIIPAERQGINLFTRDLTLYKTKIYDILTKLEIDTSSKLLGKLQENVGRYSKSVTDHIDFIAGLSSKNGQKTDFYDLVIDFEKEIMDGHIAVSEEGEIKFLTEGLELDTNSMSSTVKSLSSLMYYLKYKAKKGDFILIDEPELNLHQDNQVKLAKFLAKLTNMGIKILISTHSDYMIRVFNDLIMLNHIQTRDTSQASELAKYNGYQANELLDHKNMAVYLFRKKKKVSAVHIDETGFAIDTIDDVVDHINKTSNEIYAEL